MSADRRRLAIWIAFALFWCAIALVPLHWRFWKPFDGRLVHTFAVWESVPFHRHLFLPFFGPDDFAAGVTYTSYAQLYLVVTWVFVGVVRLVFRTGTDVAQNFIAVLYLALLLPVVVRALDRTAPVDLMRLFLGGLALGIVMTTPALVATTFVAQPDNYHPFATVLFLALATQVWQERLRGRTTLVLLGALALLAPLYAFVAVLAVALLEWPDGKRDRRWLICLALVGCLAAAALLAPHAAFHLTHMQRNLASPVKYRTGVDGEATYFTDLVQAAVDPWGRRPWHVLHLPVLAVLALAAAFIATRDRALVSRMGRQLLMAITPFLFMMAFFPQAVSIHPYNYDVHLAAGCAYALACWSLEPRLYERLRGGWALLWFFVASAVIMTNLVDIARCARLPR